MGWNDGRNRSVRKAVTFTPGEWERVERRLERAGGVYPLGWNAYARTMLLKGRYVAIEVPFDVPRVTVQVNRIGINVNQIARKCNEDDLVTVEELRQVRRELEKCYRQLDDAWKLMHMPRPSPGTGADAWTRRYRRMTSRTRHRPRRNNVLPICITILGVEGFHAR